MNYELIEVVDVEQEIEVGGASGADAILESLQHSGIVGTNVTDANSAHHAPVLLSVLSAVAAAVNTGSGDTLGVESTDAKPDCVTHALDSFPVETSGDAITSQAQDYFGDNIKMEEQQDIDILRSQVGIGDTFDNFNYTAATEESPTSSNVSSAVSQTAPEWSSRIKSQCQIPSQIGPQQSGCGADPLGARRVMFLTNIPDIIYRPITDCCGNSGFWIGDPADAVDIHQPDIMFMTDHETGIRICLSTKRIFVKKIMMGEDVIFYIAKSANEKTIMALLQTLYELKYLGDVLPGGKCGKNSIRLMTNGQITGEDHDYQRKVDEEPKFHFAPNSGDIPTGKLDDDDMIGSDLFSDTFSNNPRNLESPSAYLSAVESVKDKTPPEDSTSGNIDATVQESDLSMDRSTEQCGDKAKEQAMDKLAVADTQQVGRTGRRIKQTDAYKEYMKSIKKQNTSSDGIKACNSDNTSESASDQGITINKEDGNGTVENFSGTAKRKKGRPRKIQQILKDMKDPTYVSSPLISTDSHGAVIPKTKRPVNPPMKYEMYDNDKSVSTKMSPDPKPTTNPSFYNLSRRPRGRPKKYLTLDKTPRDKDKPPVAVYQRPDGTECGMWKSKSEVCPSLMMRRAREEKHRVACPECVTYHAPYYEKCYLVNPISIVPNPEPCKNVQMQSTNSVPDPLCLRMDSGTQQMGVYAFKKLKQYTQFGPLIGILMTQADITDAVDLSDIWFLRYEEDGERYFLYTGEPNASNWCRFLVPVFLEDANMVMVLKEEGIFFVTNRDVHQGEQLKVYIPYFGNKERVLSEDMNFLECATCRITFSSPLNLQKHWHIAHPYGVIKKKMTCSVCLLVFPSIKQLEAHCRSEHEGQGGFSCPECSMVFYHQYKLRQHRWICHPPPEAAVICPQCGKQYKNPQSLKSHIRHTHSTMSFTCPSCNKVFTKKISLMRHMRMHTENAQFSCEQCGKAFRTSWNLKIHMATHTTERPFICRDCARGFASKRLLEAHYRRVHNYSHDTIPEIKRKHLSVYDEVPTKTRRIPPATVTTDAVGPMKPLLSDTGEEIAVEEGGVEEVQEVEEMVQVVWKGQDFEDTPVLGDSSGGGYIRLQIGDQEVVVPNDGASQLIIYEEDLSHTAHTS